MQDGQPQGHSHNSHVIKESAWSGRGVVTANSILAHACESNTSTVQKLIDACPKASGMLSLGHFAEQPSLFVSNDSGG